MLILGDTATAGCSYSKETSEADSLSWHQKKCYLALCENMERRKKCAEFLEIVFVQKYLKDYECQEEKTEGILFNLCIKINYSRILLYSTFMKPGVCRQC